MKQGYLSQYFESIAVKLLSQVETDPGVSNQHEFNGVARLKKIFGSPLERREYETTFLYLTDDEDRVIQEQGKLTWYDARKKGRLERNVNRSEYRLYYSSETVMGEARENDLLVIARFRGSSSHMAIIAESQTTMFNQIVWLFDVSGSLGDRFDAQTDLDTEHHRIGYASRLILGRLGIEVETGTDRFSEHMAHEFPEGFPAAKVFSEFARGTLVDIDFRDDCDTALVSWLEREEELFKIHEKYLIGARLKRGFDGDVEGFISFSLSVHNRRKSRAGLGLENHLEYIFRETRIRFSRGAITENNSRPDFVFPGITAYHDQLFETDLLTILGVKSTCKDRWRQVLAEADRVDKKHLLTLETGISKNQTDEMASRNLQLVVPRPFHSTFLDEQRDQMLDVASFIELVLTRQRKAFETRQP